MDSETRIILDPERLTGKPVIRGTRLAVEFIIDLMSQGWTYDDILANYPGVDIQDIRACLQYARDVLHDEKMYPVGTHG